MKKFPIDISVIVTCHSEGIILHKTLLSIERALKILPNNVSTEVIIHLDNPTDAMNEYKKQLQQSFPEAIVYENTFGDPGASRNFSINKSKGKYIALIDGDDIMSRNWLSSAFETLEAKPYGEFIGHSEYTIEFGAANSIVKKYGAINKTVDSLLNTWSARWNSIIFAPSVALKRMGYPSNRNGYGYEDWLISCTFIEEGITNILIDGTVIFVRRKENNSVWDTMRASSLVLPAHPILSFEHIRSLTLPEEFAPPALGGVRSLKQRAISAARKLHIEGVARKALHHGRSVIHKATTLHRENIPHWLKVEWLKIHEIDRSIFPFESLTNSTVHHSITELHYRIGGAYKTAVDYTRFDKYNYILFVPWLVSGGGDSFAINYANQIASQDEKKRVLVIATMQGGSPSIWSNKLDSSIDFIPLNDIFDLYRLEYEHQNRIIEQIIENSKATHLHILNSSAIYDFVRRHGTYIDSSNKSVIVTSFSQSTDDTGRVFGFSHTHAPAIYNQASLYTTDNSVVKNMWVNEYGFNPEKIELHRPIARFPDYEIQREKKSKKILWAARLAPEKTPQLVLQIAELLPDYQFDMYGTPDPAFSTDFFDAAPPNVTYKGAYTDFFSLPLEDYSIYLYTSLFDGMPNALLEAAAAELPIIASSVGGVPEFIGEKRGVLIEDIHNPESYSDAIRTLYANPNRSEGYTKSASDYIKSDFSSESSSIAIKSMMDKLDY